MPRIDALYDIYGSTLSMYDWGDWRELENTVRLHLLLAEDARVTDREVNQKITTNDHTYANRVQTIINKVTKETQ